MKSSKFWFGCLVVAIAVGSSQPARACDLYSIFVGRQVNPVTGEYMTVPGWYNPCCVKPNDCHCCTTCPIGACCNCGGLGLLEPMASKSSRRTAATKKVEPQPTLAEQPKRVKAKATSSRKTHSSLKQPARSASKGSGKKAATKRG